MVNQVNLLEIAKLHRINEGLMVEGLHGETESYFGGSQRWLRTQNGKQGGCGTVTGANILAYLAMTQKNLRPLFRYPKLDMVHYVQHLEEVYHVLTPISLEQIHHRLPVWLQKKMAPSLGIPGIAFFSKRVCRFAVKRERNLQPVWVDRKGRPSHNTNLHLSMDKAVEYIREGLASGCPVAMLNGLNPRLKKIPYTGRTGSQGEGNFQRHWVTITGLYSDVESGDILLEVASWGYKALLSFQDFWGKGYTAFVYFTASSSAAVSEDH